MAQLTDRDIACARLIRKRGLGTQWHLRLIASQLNRMSAKHLQALAEKDLSNRQHEQEHDDAHT